MNFESLKDKCEYYRSLTDYKLLPNSYVLVMLDGRSFSKKVKNKFEKPFDDRFINAMNQTTQYLCSNIQGCRFGYCQSDEISLVISDISNEPGKESSSFFQYRLCKIQSLCAAMATAKFNQVMADYRLSQVVGNSASAGDTVQACREAANGPLYEFDCKAWNVPNSNDAYAWFLYRQLDCIRNSKQQFCQTYVPHKQLSGLNTDEQVNLTLQKTGKNWNDIDNGKKYGRACVRISDMFTSEVYGEYERSRWVCDVAAPFQDSKDSIIRFICGE